MVKGSRSEYDLAYGCFLLCGLTALVISAMSVIPMDPGSAGGLGILVAVPLFLVSLAAMVSGLLLSVRLWKDWSLRILSGMSILFLVEFLFEYGSAGFYNAVTGLYGVGVVAISGAWFVGVRKRRFPQF